jgi:hypothetical protein
MSAQTVNARGVGRTQIITCVGTHVGKNYFQIQKYLTRLKQYETQF